MQELLTATCTGNKNHRLRSSGFGSALIQTISCRKIHAGFEGFQFLLKIPSFVSIFWLVSTAGVWYVLCCIVSYGNKKLLKTFLTIFKEFQKLSENRFCRFPKAFEMSKNSKDLPNSFCLSISNKNKIT